MVDLGTITAHVTLDFKGLVAGVAAASGTIGKLDTIMNARVGSIAGHAVTMSNAFLGSGALIVGALGGATKSAGDFQRQME
ncbi:MAG: hypothetical protein M3Y56_07955, partial [Armatimonadota bacterium]|nr:hypothetical protein [Armatimonadota bacterium]